MNRRAGVRKMWACSAVIPWMTSLECDKSDYFNIPVAVVDLRPEAVEGYVEAMARAINARYLAASKRHGLEAAAVALAAIFGKLPLKRARKTRERGETITLH